MRQRLLVIVPLALGALLAAGCSEDPPTNAYELTGTVVNDLDGSAISGATVRFTSDTLYVTTGSTDEDGYYEMVVETDSLFGQVRAEKAGFGPAEASVYFDSPARRIDLRLRPEGR